MSAILSAPPNTIPASQQPSRTPSCNPSRVHSRAPSRTPSRPPSKSASRTVSPNRTSSRSSSKHKYAPNSHKNGEISKINEDNDEEEGSGDTSLDRMVKILSSLINEATEAVETPVVGREKKLRRVSNSNQSGLNFDDINNALDALEEEDEEAALESDSSESEEEEDEDIEEDSERGRSLKREKAHKRAKSKSELTFEDKMFEFGQSLNAFSNLVEEITTEGQDESMMQDNYGLQYLDSTADLIKNPSENLADLDEFSQQCRLLTRAFILPFLYATHNFMSESLQTNIHQSNGVKSTFRTFMNLMYWTFLFTLGSLVLDAWLCEVAGRQVIRMVDSLKPTQPFGMIYGVGQEGDYRGDYYRIDRRGSSDSRGLEEDKKKNVKFCTGLKMKAETFKGEGTKVVRCGRGVGGGKWGGGMTNTFDKNYVEEMEEDELEEEEELLEDDNDEFEIVDLYSSEDEESYIKDDNEEDLAHLLRQKITNEWLKRAGHGKSILYSKDNFAKNNVDNNVSNLLEKSNIRENQYIKSSTLINKFNANNFNNNNTYNIYNAYNTYNSYNAYNPNNPSTEEPEEYDMDDDDEDDAYDFDDINIEISIPGSFPVNNKRYTLPSTIIDETKNVRQAKGYVLRRPKRDGPFGGSGGFLVMKSRKMRTRNVTSRNINYQSVKTNNINNINKINRNIGHNRKSNSISVTNNQISKPPKRSWIRRNSI